MKVNQKKKVKRKGKRKVRYGRLALLAAGVLIPFGLVVWGVGVMMSHNIDDQQDPRNSATQKKTACVPAEGYDKCFTFAGVGDNLIHETLYEGDEPYKLARDFSSYYENIVPYMKNADLAYINFETLCAGDEFGFSGYPDFNAPKEFIDALDQAGFNWFSLASNHSLDRYPEGLLAELKDIDENHSHITYTGAHSDPKTADEPIIMDINGIKVGLATFTYGLNGRDEPKDYMWLLDLFQDNNGVIDYDLIDKRIKDLNDNSDVQIVTMHWGQEYNSQIDDLQAMLAQYLHDRGVDVIIGTHPHVIAPAEIMETGDQKTLIYYSLGNFISNQADLPTMVGGMAQFQVNLDSKTGKIAITDARFTPTITWYDNGDHNFKATTIHEYNDELAASHGVTASGGDMSVQNIKNYVSSIMDHPQGIEIILDESQNTQKEDPSKS